MSSRECAWHRDQAAGNIDTAVRDYDHDYDQDNRLTKVTYSGTAEVAHYAYDALRRTIRSQARYDSDRSRLSLHTAAPDPCSPDMPRSTGGCPGRPRPRDRSLALAARTDMLASVRTLPGSSGGARGFAHKKSRGVAAPASDCCLVEDEHAVSL